MSLKKALEVGEFLHIGAPIGITVRSDRRPLELAEILHIGGRAETPRSKEMVISGKNWKNLVKKFLKKFF